MKDDTQVKNMMVITIKGYDNLAYKKPTTMYIIVERLPGFLDHLKRIFTGDVRYTSYMNDEYSKAGT